MTTSLTNIECLIVELVAGWTNNIQSYKNFVSGLTMKMFIAIWKRPTCPFSEYYACILVTAEVSRLTKLLKFSTALKYLLTVRENFIRLSDQFELLFSFLFIVWVFVRVPLQSQLPVIKGSKPSTNNVLMKTVPHSEKKAYTGHDLFHKEVFTNWG